jgi:hypothetical protein
MLLLITESRSDNTPRGWHPWSNYQQGSSSKGAALSPNEATETQPTC